MSLLVVIHRDFSYQTFFLTSMYHLNRIMRDAISGAIIIPSIAQKWAWLGKKILSAGARYFLPHTLTFKHPPTLNPAYPPVCYTEAVASMVATPLLCSWGEAPLYNGVCMVVKFSSWLPVGLRWNALLASNQHLQTLAKLNTVRLTRTISLLL